jgi:hypothetical protein
MRQEKEGCRNLNENRKTEKQTNKKTFPLQTIYDAWLQYYTFTRPSNSPKKFCFYTSWFEVARNFQDSLEQKKILSKSTFKYKVHFLLLTSFSVTLINEQLIENVNSVILRENRTSN